MNFRAQIDIQKIRSDISNYIVNGTLDERVLQCLMTPEGFVPKECELWDYKETANTDAVSKGKTILQITSFYNAYGGYILYGIAENGDLKNYKAKGINPNCVDEQQIRTLLREYTGEVIDFSYIEISHFHNSENLLFGLLHIPKRSLTDPPLFFIKNGPEDKKGKLIFQKDQAYVRIHDNCMVAQGKKALQFLFGKRELEIDGSENNLRNLASKEIIQDHNLPDRRVICSKFFGRDAIIERLWLWLSDEFSKTRLLAGEGGKGKTSIAYEFCEEVCRARPFNLTRVFWVTAKEKQFSGMQNEYIDMPETHFYDLNSLLQALCAGFAILEKEIESGNVRILKKKLQDALRLFPSLVVIDDIDSVQNLDDQKRILELCSEISSGTQSYFLLTTRMNLISSSDICITVPGLSKIEYQPYVTYLNEFIGSPPIKKGDINLLWESLMSQ